MTAPRIMMATPLRAGKTKTAAEAHGARAAEEFPGQTTLLVGDAAAKRLALGRFHLLAGEQRIDRVRDVMFGWLLVVIVKRADVSHVAVLIEHKDMRRHAGAVFGGQLAALIKHVRKV